MARSEPTTPATAPIFTYDARYGADLQDVPFFVPGGSYLHTLFNTHIDTLLLPTLPSSTTIMIP
jgi:hypothetical protein